MLSGMKTMVRALAALLLVSFTSALSGLAVVIADSFCPSVGSGATDFAGGMLVLVSCGAAFFIGGFVAAHALRKQQGNWTLLRLAMLLICLPLLCLAIFAFGDYRSCPGYGRPSTPEQLENLKHGAAPSIGDWLEAAAQPFAAADGFAAR